MDDVIDDPKDAVLKVVDGQLDVGWGRSGRRERSDAEERER